MQSTIVLEENKVEVYIMISNEYDNCERDITILVKRMNLIFND